MRLTVTTLADEIFNLDVSEDLELENFKAFCEVESGIPAAEISLVWNGKVMEDDRKNLKSYGVKDGDVIVIQRQRLASNPSQGIYHTITALKTRQIIPVIRDPTS